MAALIEPDPTSTDELARLSAEALMHAPGFTLRGGTTPAQCDRAIKWGR